MIKLFGKNEKHMETKRTCNIPLILFLIFVPVCLLIIGEVVFSNRTAPVAVKGVLSCSSIDNRSPVALRGEWEYYDNVFLYPSDFSYDAGAKNGRKPDYVHVPGELPNAYGYGTYRLVFTCISRSQLFAVKTTDIRSSTRIYVDGKEIGTQGDPSTLPNASVPWNSSQYIVFTMDTLRTAHDVIIHVSNYNYYKKGIITPLYFGTQIKAYELSNSARLADSMVLVSVCLLSLLLFLMLVLHIKMGNIRYLLVFSVVLVLHLGCGGEKLFLSFFPMIGYVPFTRIFLATYPLMGLFMLLYLCEPSVGNLFRYSCFTMMGMGASLAALILFSPQKMQKDLFYAIVFYIAVIFLFCAVQLFSRLLKRDFEALCQIAGLICWILYFGVCYLYGAGYVYDQSRNALISFFIIGFVVVQLVYVAQRVARIYSGNERLAQRMVISDKLKNELMEVTSHELRTPLHGIINITESVVSNMARDQKNHADICDLNMVLTLAQRMRNIVNDLYDYRGRNGNRKFECLPTNLNVEVNAVFEMFQYITNQNRIRFVNQIAPDAFTVYADEERLWQVLNNLLGNAVKYTESGSVTVCSRKNEDKVFISVIDTGIGMPMAEAEKIFERASRLPAAAKQADGQGLGLYIARQMVEEMGGTIYVEQSRPGQGTSITFVLPACDEALYEKAKNTEKKIAPEGHAPTLTVLDSMSPAGANLLVVDDNRDNLNVVCKIFEDCNFTIDIANRGEAALDLFRKKEYDIVILDVMMPGMTGFEICQKIRERYSPFELPVVLLTARGSTEDILTGFWSGANDYVVKPADSVELRARVFNLIALRQSVSNAIDNELSFLQAQIKPHFLYNAFNTISAIALTDGATASELIDDLGIYLRKCFQTDTGDSLVSAENELEMVRAYVRIEKARFGERLNVIFNIPDNVFFLLPPLTIQPIVENAIRHGSLNSCGHTRVTIHIFRDKSDYVIAISDNGAGIDVDQISSALNGDAEKKWSGIGLQNVNRRLKLRYNRTLEFSNPESGGTCVTIRIPDETV